MNVLVWLMTLCLPLTVQAQNCKKEARCRISRVHGMKGADCYKRDMREFPRCLPSDVEIIDLSVNRVRKIGKSDLTKYSDLQMLYLHDNVVVTIDEDAFAGKDDLHTLDLSLNAISKLPPVVFQLPSLKSLYLGQNLNINIVDAVETKPITSPLVHLDISYVMSEEPSNLPDLGTLPLLMKYNISGNKLMDVTTQHFAGLCSLKLLDTTNVTIEYGEPCDCWTLNHWLKARKVQFRKFSCEISEDECASNVPAADQEVYEKCQKEAEALLKKSQMLKIVIPIVVVLAVMVCIAVCLIVRRKRRQKLLTKKYKAEEQILYDNELVRV